MKRSKDDKRVLRSGNGRQSNSRRPKRGNRQLIPRVRRNHNNYGNGVPRNVKNPRNRRNKKKRSNKLVFIMIVALVTFVIGAGIGVSLSFDNGNDDEGPHYENVTKEMTSNLNNTTDVYFDKTTDDIDFNENESSQISAQNTYSG